MRIKGSNGEEYNVPGQGQANFNTAGGIAGILSLLGFDLGGILGNRYNPNMSPQALYDALNASRNNSNNGIIEAILTAMISLIPSLMCGNRRGYDDDYRGGRCSENTHVTRWDLEQSEKMQDLKSENALLKADKYTDQKIVEAYKDLQGQIKDVAAEVRANKDAQTEINREQAVYNGINTANLKALKGQVADLASLSELVVPKRKVCNTCCKECDDE